jgi:hypothetical protein
MMYVCGSSGPFDDFNPSLVVRRKQASDLLLLLNERPRRVDEITSMLKVDRGEVSSALEGLLRIEALKKDNEIYRVAFPIFTRHDLLLIQRVTKSVALDLAKSICTSASEIAYMSKGFSCVEQVGTGKLLFAAIGCFVLDWLGLKTLEREGLLRAGKPKPGNRNYLLFAREQVEPETATKLYDKMYWGSHSDSIGNLVFTSFGDHHGVRNAFPDVSWTLQALPKITDKTDAIPSWMAEELSRLASLQSKTLMREVGSLLISLSKKEATLEAKKKDAYADKAGLLGLLEDMDYVLNEGGVFRLNYPVFMADDKKVIDDLGNVIIPMVTKLIRRNREKLQKALTDISPMRNAVDFNEVMTDLWHWIFAQTNRILAEKGVLYDPPKKNVEEARYIAWVSEFAFP